MTDIDHAAEAKASHEALIRKCFMLAKEIGLTDRQRHELSIMVVPNDHSRSWHAMSFEQTGRLCDYLVGWAFVQTVLNQPTTKGPHP